jgi:hypothetical protein
MSAFRAGDQLEEDCLWPTPVILGANASGGNRCEVEVRDNNPTDETGRKPALHA